MRISVNKTTTKISNFVSNSGRWILDTYLTIFYTIWQSKQYREPRYYLVKRKWVWLLFYPVVLPIYIVANILLSFIEAFVVLTNDNRFSYLESCNDKKFVKRILFLKGTKS